MEDLSAKSEYATKGARDMTADALSRLETGIRGQLCISQETKESVFYNSGLIERFRPRGTSVEILCARFIQ